MHDQLTERVVEEGRYIAQTGATVRATAKVFHFSKSTVHKDVSERLEKIYLELYKKVQKVLEKNLLERHLRGGEATRVKYLKNRTQK